MSKGNNRAKRKLSEPSISSPRSSSSSSPSPPYENKEKSGNLNSNDNDLFSAAEALTQLTRSATPPLAINSRLPSIPTPVSSLSSSIDDRNNEKKPEHKTNQGEHPLVTKVSKVSKHPIVTNAVKYYENSKRNYGAFNYAAGIVEKAAIPVVNKIEVNLNNRYQAKQLRLEGESTQEPSVTVKKRRLGGAGDYNKVVTMETKKRLQFCLHLLRLANDRINYKVNFLQQKVIDKERSIKEKRSLNNTASKANDIHDEDVAESEEDSGTTTDKTANANNNNNTNDVPTQDAQSEAQQTKTEIVATVKKIIHVISTFKPSSLNTNTISPDINEVDPETRSEDLEFKSTIRDIILKLPTTIQQAAISNNTSAQQANDRIFVFARESLEMITRLTNVFNGQLEHAEQWLAGEMQKERERRKMLESKEETRKQLAIEQNGTNISEGSDFDKEKAEAEQEITQRHKVADASKKEPVQEEISYEEQARTSV